VQLTEQGYSELKYRMVVTHAYNGLLSLKESYLIGKKNNPNPFVILYFMETSMIILNPTIPHFCENVWTKYVRPVLMKCKNLPSQPAENLIDQGWPCNL